MQTDECVLTCALPGCSASCSIDHSTGVMYNFCCREHASQSSQHSQHHAQTSLQDFDFGQCQLDGCAAPVYVDRETGEVHNFCSREHALAATRGNSSTIHHAPPRAPGATAHRHGRLQPHDMSYEALLALDDDVKPRGNAKRPLHELVACSILSSVQDLPQDSRECSICLSDFCDGEQVARLPCLHLFHQECCQSWFANKACCPVCQTPV